MNEAFQKELQRRLDWMDEYIDTLEREKQHFDDADTSTITEGKHYQQKAREHNNRGEFPAAWRALHMAGGLIIEGQREVREDRRISDEIDKHFKK